MAHVNQHFVGFPHVNGGWGRLKKQYPNPANASLAEESKQSNLGYSELKAPVLHGAGGVRLPTLEKLLLNQLCARKGDKVSCRASRDKGEPLNPGC